MEWRELPAGTAVLLLQRAMLHDFDGDSRGRHCWFEEPEHPRQVPFQIDRRFALAVRPVLRNLDQFTKELVDFLLELSPHTMAALFRCLY